MDPHDELLLVHHGVLYTKVDAHCDKLHDQACLCNVDRRKYCQLVLCD